MRRLHSIAGTAATLGCIALSDVARDLEVDHTAQEAQQRFVETAKATLRVIRAYSTA
jgi:HPt (histidine-containing phosphotransfer) domain-containing protein